MPPGYPQRGRALPGTSTITPARRLAGEWKRELPGSRALPRFHGHRITTLPMETDSAQNAVVRVEGLSNREFLERFAEAGRIGLSGGVTLVDKAICRAERHLDAERHWGSWSHAFIFEGRRPDARHWLIESDLQVHRKHIQLGVQENRVDKYFDEKLYTSLAVLDFGLSAGQTSGLVAEGLELVATHARYSLRELIGTCLALKKPSLRARENLLARGNSLFCSAFVQHLFRQAGIDLAPGVDLKNTTPEDLFRTALPHRVWLLQRPPAVPRLKRLRARLEGRVIEKWRRLPLAGRRRKPAALGESSATPGF